MPIVYICIADCIVSITTNINRNTLQDRIGWCRHLHAWHGLNPLSVCAMSHQTRECHPRPRGWAVPYARTGAFSVAGVAEKMGNRAVIRVIPASRRRDRFYRTLQAAALPRNDATLERLLHDDQCKTAHGSCGSHPWSVLR